MLNRTQIIARVGADAIVKEIGGKQMTTFRVAHTDKWKNKQGEDQERTTWYNCLYHSDKVAQWITKGKLLYLEGQMYATAWTDKDGNNKAELNLRVSKFDFLSSGGSSSAESKPAQAEAKQDDLPF